MLNHSSTTIPRPHPPSHLVRMHLIAAVCRSHSGLAESAGLAKWLSGCLLSQNISLSLKPNEKHPLPSSVIVKSPLTSATPARLSILSIQLLIYLYMCQFGNLCCHFTHCYNICLTKHWWVRQFRWWIERLKFYHQLIVLISIISILLFLIVVFLEGGYFICSLTFTV